MLCRITGKVCTAWSETAGCGMVRCKFVEDKGGDEGMTDRRKDCPMRHENGNCTVAGGFCTAVNDPVCEALHNAFDCGYRSSLRQQEHFREVTKNAGPQWISVKDRMPEQEECVLLLCKTQYGTSYKCIGFYEYGTMRRDDSDYCWDYEVCDIYDEENDDYLVNKGWFERVFNWDDYSACGIDDAVTHWMPLPKPPEEGTE